MSLFASINWNEAFDEAEKDSQLEDGSYVCQIKSVKEAKSKTGKFQLKIQYSIASGPNVGNILFDTLTFSPENAQAVGIFKRTVLTIAGPNGLDCLTSNDLPGLIDCAVGRFVEVVKATREWNGNTYDNVVKISNISEELLQELGQSGELGNAQVEKPRTVVSSNAPPPPPPV